jgi:hypothetical protein
VFVTARTFADPEPAGGVGVVLLTTSHDGSLLTAVHVQASFGAVTKIFQLASVEPT